MTARFQRANFVVRDLARALTFYRDVVGFEVSSMKGHNPHSYSFAVFEIPRDVSIGFCVLSLPDQPRVMALTEIQSSMISATPRPRRGAVVLEVTDLDAVVEGARKLGLHVYDEAELISTAGRRGREVGIVDFDDNLLVIYKLMDSAQ